MAPSCDSGWVLHSIPSKPRDTLEMQPPDKFQRGRYEWEVANNSVRPLCACGQECTFTYAFELGEAASISIGFERTIVVDGALDYSSSEGVGVEVNLGDKEFEYKGYPVVLKFIKETGTCSTSGGLGIGFFSAVWRFIRYGPLGLIPQMTLTVNTADVIYLSAGWMICKRPCSKKDS
jgi:hypothetical protein